MIWQGSGVSSRSTPRDSPDLSPHVFSTCDSQNAKHRHMHFLTGNPTHSQLPCFTPRSRFQLLTVQDPFSPSQAHNWKAWWLLSYLLKSCFLLPLDGGFKVAGCLPERPLPAAGRCPEALSSRSLSAVPGLASEGPVSSQSFPSYCFPGSLQLQQLFTSPGLPFFGRGLSFSPAAFSHPPAIQAPALLPYLFPSSSVTTHEALLPSLHVQLGECWLCLHSSLTTLWTPLSPSLCREGVQRGLVQHDRLIQNILLQPKVQLRGREAMEDMLKFCI